jgi:hypothetical protein
MGNSRLAVGCIVILTVSRVWGWHESNDCIAGAGRRLHVGGGLHGRAYLQRRPRRPVHEGLPDRR